MPRRVGSSRREFLRQVAASGASIPFLSPRRQQERHPVPGKKVIPAAWQKDLLAPATDRTLRGKDHAAVAMPVCGIGTGQLYLLPDGTLETWDLFNDVRFSGYGRDNYGRGVPKAEVPQGFGIFLDGRFRPLSALGFTETAFRGSYPIGRVDYLDATYPLAVRLEAFSPFVPLDAQESGLPATVFRIHLRNRTDKPVRGRLVAWLGNVVCRRSRSQHGGEKVSALTAVGAEPRAALLHRAEAPQSAAATPTRPRIRFADFEGKDFGKWKADGEAFAGGPAAGTLPDQQAVSGFAGRRLVNSFRGGDDSTGTLTSPAFELERRFVNLLVGGGNHREKTEVALVVDGKVVHRASGENSEKLRWVAWNVEELQGKQAHIVIRDEQKGAWGHVLCDEIEMADEARLETQLETQPDYVELALAGPGTPAAWHLDLPAASDRRTIDAAQCLDANGAFRSPAGAPELRLPLAREPIGGLAFDFEIEPGDEQSFPFVLTWFAPNHPWGRFYATRFHGAAHVAAYVLDHLARLEGDTRKFVATYWDSTLPPWLLDRTLFPIANLATSLVQWRRSGRFWGWEGVGCCAGTCTHVWNYAQAMGALFPELERNVRELQDFGEGFDEASGLVGFRSNRSYAADGQCGTVLKAYREHLHAPDDAFLRRNWPRIRMALEYMLKRDGDGDGLLEDDQHNTYDIEFWGANTFVGALYLAALRAGEEMARRVGDPIFAKGLRLVFEEGRRRTMELLWNGEYFQQNVDLAAHPRAQYADGCLSDQLFGQNWAHQLGLGYLYPAEAVRRALRAIYEYNWATDVGPYNEAHKPERVFAWPGEPGLFTCTWPKSEFLPQGVRYRSEVWTGIEHQVASHMLREGMIEEGLHVVRGIEARYDGKRSNPYNEVECGDHYARALASWANLTALMGFELDGPAGRYRFEPRITPERFKAFFAGPEGWGSYEQTRNGKSQVCRIVVEHGRIVLRELEVPAMAGTTRVEIVASRRDGVERRGGFAAGAPTDRGTYRVPFEELTLDASGLSILELRFG